MTISRARRHDILALLTVVIVIVLDLWTKVLVVTRLSPPESKAPIPLIGQYLTIYYLQNRGAAFGLFANSITLVVLIAFAIGVVAYLYYRILNTGPFAYKIVFGMIIGGAIGNLISRVQYGGSVVDFIFFRIPEINYRFAVFNIADASISVGIFLFFVFVLFGGLRRPAGRDKNVQQPATPPTSSGGTLRPTEHDAQS